MDSMAPAFPPAIVPDKHGWGGGGGKSTRKTEISDCVDGDAAVSPVNMYRVVL